MRWLLALALLCLPVSGFAHSISGIDDIDPNISRELQEKLDTAIATYYEAPLPSKIETVLDIMNDSDVLRKKTSHPPLVGFFTIVFANNKDQVFGWISRNDYNEYAQYIILSALQHAKLNEAAYIFAQAHQWNAEQLKTLRETKDSINLKKLKVSLPGHIDTLWGAFFASGEAIYVNEIIDVLFMKALPAHHPNTGASSPSQVLQENKKLAETTLKQYALSHVKLRAIMAARLDKESPSHKKIMQQLLP